MNTNLNNKKLIVMDIENPNKDCNSICSIALLVVDGDNITREIYSLINPEDRFDDRNSHICKITPDMVTSSPTILDFYNEYKNYFNGDYIIMGHNINYDLTVLAKALYSYNIELNELPFICTWELSEKYMTDLSSHKLRNILETLNYEYDAHNALSDSYAALYLYNYMDNKYNHTMINDFNDHIKTFKYRRKKKDIIRGEDIKEQN